MEKFYWEPTHEDKIGIVYGIFEADGLSKLEITQLVDRFPDRAIDFFGAMRARIYDEQIRDFIDRVGIDRVSSLVVNPADGNTPTFPKPNFSLARLMEFGHLLVQEQQLIDNSKLVEEYNKVRYGHPPKLATISPAQGNSYSDYY
jgi:hypothetical protein